MSQLTIKTFGIISDIVGENSFVFDFVGNTQLLRKNLLHQYPGLQSLTFSIAVNKCLVLEPTDLKNGDEIALLPPFSGG